MVRESPGSMQGPTTRPRRFLAAALLVLLPFVSGSDVLAGGAAWLASLGGEHEVALRADASHVDLVLMHDRPAPAENIGPVLTCGTEHVAGAHDALPHPSHADHQFHLWSKAVNGDGIAAQNASPAAAAPTLTASTAVVLAPLRAAVSTTPESAAPRDLRDLRTIVLRV